MCHTCGVEYPKTDEFFGYRNKKKSNTLRSECKKCRYLSTRSYAVANPQRIKQLQKQYRKNNPEKVKSSNKKFREENPDYAKNYRYKNSVSDNDDAWYVPLKNSRK